MSDNGIEFSKDLIIRNQLGLHARSAAMIAKIAQEAAGKIWIIKDDEKADAASIIDMLTLACARGTQISVQIEIEADLDRLREIAELIENGFGE